MSPFLHIDFYKKEEGEDWQKDMLTVVIGPRHYQKTQGCVNGQVLPILTFLHAHGREYNTSRTYANPHHVALHMDISAQPYVVSCHVQLIL